MPFFFKFFFRTANSHKYHTENTSTNSSYLCKHQGESERESPATEKGSTCSGVRDRETETERGPQA